MINFTDKQDQSERTNKIQQIKLKIPQSLTNYSSEFQEITQNNKSLWEMPHNQYYKVELSLLTDQREIATSQQCISSIVNHLKSIGILKELQNNQPSGIDIQQSQYTIRNKTLLILNSEQYAQEMLKDQANNINQKSQQNNFQQTEQEININATRKVSTENDEQQFQVRKQSREISRTKDQLQSIKQAIQRKNKQSNVEVTLTFIQIVNNQFQQEDLEQNQVQLRVFCIKKVPKMTVIPTDIDQLNDYRIFVDEECTTPLQKLSIAVKSKKFYCKRRFQSKITTKQQDELNAVNELKNTKSDQTSQLNKFNNRSASGPIKINATVLQKILSNYQSPSKQKDLDKFSEQKNEMQFDNQYPNKEKINDNSQRFSQTIFRISKRKEIGIQKRSQPSSKKTSPIKNGQNHKIFMNNLIQYQISSSEMSRQEKNKQIMQIYSNKNNKHIQRLQTNGLKKRLKSDSPSQEDFIKTQQIERKDGQLNPQLLSHASSNIFKIKKKASKNEKHKPQTKVTVANLLQIYANKKKKKERLDKLIEDI